MIAVLIDALTQVFDQVYNLIYSQIVVIDPQNTLSVLYIILNFLAQLFVGPLTGGGIDINLPF